MQPYLFPYIGYFQLINAVDKIILYDNLNFIKEAWVNRNRILVKNVGPMWISVPLVQKSSNAKISDICIDSNQNWQDKMKKSLELNYRKAPMFETIFPMVSNIIDNKTQKLSEFNAYSIQKISDYIGLKACITQNSDDYLFIEEGLNKLELENHYKKIDNLDIDKKNLRIFEICNYEKADVFINPIGGKKMYSKELFLKNDIELRFVSTDFIRYNQFGAEYFPSLSIIDIMMFNRVGDIEKILNAYELV